jgi:uncharacterized protein (TIGR02588 family)
MAGKKHDPVPALEWAMAALGVIAALLVLGILAREAMVGRHNPVPALSVKAERVVRTPGGHVVEFTVTNRSNQTAAAVQVEGRIGTGADEEASSATIDYVPGQSSATGGVLFSSDPRTGGMELRVTGYEIP